MALAEDAASVLEEFVQNGKNAVVDPSSSGAYVLSSRKSSC